VYPLHLLMRRTSSGRSRIFSVIVACFPDFTRVVSPSPGRLAHYDVCRCPRLRSARISGSRVAFCRYFPDVSWRRPYHLISLRSFDFLSSSSWNYGYPAAITHPARTPCPWPLSLPPEACSPGSWELRVVLTSTLALEALPNEACFENEAMWPYILGITPLGEVKGCTLRFNPTSM